MANNPIKFSDPTGHSAYENGYWPGATPEYTPTPTPTPSPQPTPQTPYPSATPTPTEAPGYYRDTRPTATPNPNYPPGEEFCVATIGFDDADVGNIILDVVSGVSGGWLKKSVDYISLGMNVAQNASDYASGNLNGKNVFGLVVSVSGLPVFGEVADVIVIGYQANQCVDSAVNPGPTYTPTSTSTTWPTLTNTPTANYTPTYTPTAPGYHW
jgi:hypothetical protein